jgi:hypothetical protein
MKVWILFHSIPYEGDTVIGVYASEEKALEAKELCTRIHGENYPVVEWDVNDMTQYHARTAANLIVTLFETLGKNGVFINLESCCCKEAIRVIGADATHVKIQDTPTDWEIIND